MRRFAALLYLFSLAFAVTAQAEDWTTADGKTYKNVVVVDQETDGVRITYTGGVGKIPYYELSDDLLKRFGQDPATLSAKRQAAREAAAAAALQAQQDAAAAAAAAQNTPPPQQPSSTPSAASTSTSTPAPPTPAPANPSPGPAPTSTANANPAPHPAPPPASVQLNQGPAPGSPVAASAAVPTEENPYPHSKYQYNENLDMSYLDSFTINVQPVLLDTTATSVASAPGATLFLRIETEGHKAEAPDSVAGNFVSSVPLKKLDKDRSVKFLVDGSYIQATPVQVDSDDAPDPSQLLLQVTFTLTPRANAVDHPWEKGEFQRGGYDYRIDDPGILALRGYLDDVDHLPPPSTSIVKSYHRFLNRLPSIITMISTTCEYIILGAFAIVVLASIAAFAMGLTRFIKM